MNKGGRRCIGLLAVCQASGPQPVQDWESQVTLEALSPETLLTPPPPGSTRGRSGPRG